MYTQVFNNEKDQDIFIQLGDLREVAANFGSLWNGVSSMINSARPHVLGLIRQLENDGREADAKEIRKLYDSTLASGKRLLQEVNGILREVTQQKQRLCGRGFRNL
jgi:hypothetical protein